MAKKKKTVATRSPGKTGKGARPQKNTPAQTKAKAKKPAVRPIRPPTGTYDPTLDAQERASQRGLGDLVEDIGAKAGTQAVRAQSDLITQTQDLARQRAEMAGDAAQQRTQIGQSYSRNLSDLLQARGYTTQDYKTGLENLQRSYQQLGDTQAQAGNQRGLAGGFTAQAARKRAANQAIDKAPIDTNFQRAMTESRTAQTRLAQDEQSSLGDLLKQSYRSSQAIDRAGGQLSQGYTRGTQDRATQLERARRENTAFGLDVAAQRRYQAGSAGWSPPKAKPKVKKIVAKVSKPRIGRGAKAVY
jgi:hypothetical protein